MDEKTAGNLSKFMLDLHEEGMGIISRNVFLKKYRFLQESFDLFPVQDLWKPGDDFRSAQVTKGVLVHNPFLKKELIKAF